MMYNAVHLRFLAKLYTQDWFKMRMRQLMVSEIDSLEIGVELVDGVWKIAIL